MIAISRINVSRVGNKEKIEIKVALDEFLMYNLNGDKQHKWRLSGFDFGQAQELLFPSINFTNKQSGNTSRTVSGLTAQR